MSWQDELRKLDEALAAGRISADEYRVRRDQVLATAASIPASEPRKAPVGESTHLIQPPPAPQPPVAEEDSAEQTQILPKVVEGQERTQTVAGWQAIPPEGDAERTQTVSSVPLQTGAGAYQPSDQFRPGGWQQDEDPPWAGQDFPPLAPAANPDWVRQGPELFETTGRSKTGKIVLISLVVVLVAAIGAGSYFLFIRNKDGGQPPALPSTSASAPRTSAPTTTSRPKDKLSTAELPGKAEDHSKIRSFADAEASNFLTKDEIAIYKNAGAGKSRLVASTTDDGVHVLIFTSEATAAAQAAAASDALAQQQVVYGMTPYKNTPAKVLTHEFAKTEKIPATIRAHYAHNGTIVRIQVNGDDLAKVSQVFDDLVAAQLEVLAANG